MGFFHNELKKYGIESESDKQEIAFIHTDENVYETKQKERIVSHEGSISKSLIEFDDRDHKATNGNENVWRLDDEAHENRKKTKDYLEGFPFEIAEKQNTKGPKIYKGEQGHIEGRASKMNVNRTIRNLPMPDAILWGISLVLGIIILANLQTILYRIASFLMTLLSSLLGILVFFSVVTGFIYYLYRQTRRR